MKQHDFPSTSVESDDSFSDRDSVFDAGLNQLSDDGTDLSDIDGDADDGSKLHNGNAFSPEYYLRMEQEFDGDRVADKRYAPRTTKQLDGIEWRWNEYCKFTRRDPVHTMHDISINTASAFFRWVMKQTTGYKGRKLPGLKSFYSLELYWKDFRLVYRRLTKKRIDRDLDDKMLNVIRELAEEYGLSYQRRENRCMSMRDLELQAETTMVTTRKKFRIGEHRIVALLFLLLIAPSGSRPEALLHLRYGDIKVVLSRDPDGGPHKALIRFSLHFTKTFLGPKAANEMTIPESLFDPCFLLCPHSLLLGLIFRHRAFEAPSLTTPELLSKLDIHPDEYELPLPLKESMDEIFVFRQAIKTAFNGYEISANKRMTYSMISSWTKRIGVLAGFGHTVILYTLRYTTANALDQSVNVSNGVRDLLLGHKNSNVFRNHYLSRVVTVDTMAVVRQTKPQDALMRQATSIGHSKSKRRPVDLTSEQVTEVDGHPQIQKLLQRQRALRQETSRSAKDRMRLESITKRLQSERAKRRREFTQQVRNDWSREQAVVDIERQLAGKSFEELPPSTCVTDSHPAQRRLVDALKAPAASTIEDEFRRRDEAIMAVMAYCTIQEGPTTCCRLDQSISKGDDSQAAKTSNKSHQTHKKLADAITSVFITNEQERPRRCFICVGRATSLLSSDPGIQNLIKPFYASGDLSKHFRRHHLSNIQDDEELYCRLCQLSLDEKMHLQNHAMRIHGTVS
ncbi:hypothetical protein TOPH_09202 [Tolypocladium ophioglossoides CBS 100239]|uniref:C2H2-type domain-containing protein n=1 Tax=Tolypocladium ophioglossoides (strain CBS 100239) TaxID=1163406 RepID=A0A0L0MW81_TOLOC|nr:hypothetical protein TOPH_09202 [Tolypocladium ophioglossoides CBS 100239]